MVKDLIQDLEGWREVIIHAHSLLTWKKNYYPMITISMTTIIYLMIWWLEPSVLVLLSMIGIIVTLLDFLVPRTVPQLFGYDYWTGMHETKYQEIVAKMVENFYRFHEIKNGIVTLRLTSPKMFMLMVCIVLGVTTWMGSLLSSLLFLCLMTNLLLLLPGMLKNEKFAQALDMLAIPYAYALKKTA